MKIRLVTRILLAGALCLLPAPALAWNAAGHRLSASIAWEKLEDSTRRQLAELLQRHPDYARWLDHAPEGDATRTAFIEAATWPDDIRKDPRFYDAGRDEPRITLPGFPDMERRRNWHYVETPPAGQRPVRGELDIRLETLARTLGDASATPQARAYALPWLIHLVGDAHQPLHTASRYDSEMHSDEGGNKLTVLTPFHPRLASMNLHAYWDDLPGPPWLRGSRLAAATQALSAMHAGLAHTGTPGQWIAESRKIARDNAYPPDGEATPTLSPSFHDKAQEIARQRVAQAGFRLAELLNRLLHAQRRPHREE